MSKSSSGVLGGENGSIREGTSLPPELRVLKSHRGLVEDSTESVVFTPKTHRGQPSHRGLRSVDRGS